MITLSFLLALACTSPTDTEVQETDTGVDREPHPMVPEQYQNLWHTESCTKRTQDGHTYEADQVYAVMTDAVATEDSFTGTELWYWFFEEDGWEDDCIDKIKVEGTRLHADFQTYGCSECNDGWNVIRTVEEQTCEGVYYRYLLHETEALSERYDSIMLFDTITPSGTLNEDNAMRISYGEIDGEGKLNMNHDWCWGSECFVHYDDAWEPPATYAWVHEDCYGS